MIKEKELHFKTTEEQFKRFSKLAIDEEVTRGQFMYRAIDFYCDYLEAIPLNNNLTFLNWKTKIPCKAD